ncbi:MAG: hypothetical protein ABJN26_15025 [Stappiaceae bacterium]
MKIKILALSLLTCSSLGAIAQGQPPLSYFDGNYEIVGRQADSLTELVGGDLTIATQGERLILTSKTAGRGWLARKSGGGEGASPLAGKLNGREIFCLFQNDPDNYPRLTCKTQPNTPDGAPGLYTFWPQP